VLHQGKVLSHGAVAEVQADPKVQEVYLGTAGAATTDAMSVVPEAVAVGLASSPPVSTVRLVSSPEMAAGAQKQEED
jgi:urea transport system ATP-binding protein